MKPIAIFAAALVLAGGAADARSWDQTAMTTAETASIEAEIKALDTRFQAATKANDAAGVDAALPEDYILIVGDGRVITKADLVRAAREETVVYDLQDPSQQTVRVFGRDVAVITALLRIKGKSAGKPVDFSVWYSDTYVRRPEGWRYVLGQAGQRLPAQ